MDPTVGNRVLATIKGADVPAIVINRMGTRLRLQTDDGISCWSEVKNVLEILNSSAEHAQAPAANALTTAAPAGKAPKSPLPRSSAAPRAPSALPATGSLPGVKPRRGTGFHLF